MQIKNVEALKTWLTARLEKICDADPAALAKYVVALIRKDKPLGELEEICIDQLEVFLSDETVLFVETLFEVLQNNSYIPAPPKPTTPLPAELPKQISPPKVSNQPKVSNPPKASNPPKVNNSPKVNVPPKISIPAKQVSPPKPSNPPKQSSVSPKQSSAPKPSVSPPKATTPKASVSPQQLNPPSPPKPVHKRLLSTDESFRPQSAESSVLDEDDRDFKRTRKPVEENEEKPILIISRDYHSSHKAKKRRTESDQDGGTRIKLSKDDTSENVKNEVKLKNKEEESSRTKDDERNKDEDASKKKDDEQSVEHDRSEKKRENSSDREGFQRSSDNSKAKHGRFDENRSVKSRLYKGRPWNKRGRCRDYDEKGYCMRGELCPYDHGNDPLVVEDVNIPGIVLGFPRAPHPAAFMEAAGLNPAGLIRAPMPTIQYPVRPSAHVTANVHVPTSDRPDAVGVRTSNDERRSAIVPPQIANVRPHIGVTRYKEVLPNMNDMYNPEQPSFDGRLPEKPPVWARLGAQPAHLSNMPLVQRNRGLLQVATSQTPPSVSTPGTQETKNTVVVTPSTSNSAPPAVVTPPVQEQSNVRTVATTAPPRKYTNTVLEVKKLQPSMNNIATLNGYFQRFGKIVNIQVSAMGQPDVALIQFSNNFEAHKAISCADAVLGNRFIRVFWHKSGDGQSKSQTESLERSQPATIPATIKPTVIEKPVAPTMFHSGQTSYKASAPAAVVQKKDASARAVEEVVKKKILLQKQKQNLLCKQIENQKLLIKKLEQNKNLHQRDKEKIMQTLKNVSESISKLQNEVKVSAALVRSKESPARARQVAQKELLDRELDLITHEQTGEDTTELKYRVEELKKEAQSLGLLDAGYRGRGRGRAGRVMSRGISRGRGRAVVSRSAAVLDKRPKQLLVEGFTTEERTLVEQRFKEFGEIDRVEEDKDGHRLMITFGTRKQAENAITHVPSFNMKNLKVSWYRPTSTSSPPVSSPVSLKIPIGTSQEQVDVEENALDQDVEDLLLQEELDEEDDEEDRTWRR